MGIGQPTILDKKKDEEKENNIVYVNNDFDFPHGILYNDKYMLIDVWVFSHPFNDEIDFSLTFSHSILLLFNASVKKTHGSSYLCRKKNVFDFVFLTKMNQKSFESLIMVLNGGISLSDYHLIH